jgi:hypothetical protein
VVVLRDDENGMGEDTGGGRGEEAGARRSYKTWGRRGDESWRGPGDDTRGGLDEKEEEGWAPAPRAFPRGEGAGPGREAGGEARDGGCGEAGGATGSMSRSASDNPRVGAARGGRLPIGVRGGGVGIGFRLVDRRRGIEGGAAVCDW